MNSTSATPVPPTQPDRTPIVEFEYPDSTTGKMKLRYLRVVDADADYVKGYELENPYSKKDGQFKTFLRTKLPRHGVSLIAF
jgi:hypothetical protein